MPLVFAPQPSRILLEESVKLELDSDPTVEGCTGRKATEDSSFLYWTVMGFSTFQGIRRCCLSGQLSAKADIQWECMSSKQSYELVTGDRILLLTGMAIARFMVRYYTKLVVSAPQLSPLLS